LLGPTASGKSALAMALAGRLPVEIVVMDSAQVYRGMDIGTAKPGAEERARVPHHLIDLVDPDEPYSAGRWRVEAVAAVKAILSRGRVPLIVGGTMLYYRALVHGLDALPHADPALRAAIDAQAAERGWPALHAELARIDPAAAQRIMPNDGQRIQRALEVWRLTGRPLSALQGAAAPALPFAVRAFSIEIDRRELHERIARRFDAMLRAGLLEELRAIQKRYRVTARTPSMRAVGYRQAWEHLEGRTTGDEMRQRAIAATRQLAQRQMTWLRRLPDVQALPPDPERLAAIAGGRESAAPPPA
jgi:tRNA dimethylallyltransferase